MTVPVPCRRLGVYGGSFDPVHVGHLEPLEEARRRLGLDAVLFVPAFQPPHKPTGPSASSYHRFAMVALAIEPYPAFRLSDFETERGGTTYTVETLRHLRAVHPGTEILLVLGSDSLVSLTSWREWREIVQSHRIAVVHREPHDYSAVKAALPPELLPLLAPEGAVPGDESDGATIFWGANRPVTISSTWIRKAIETGQALAGSVPPPVEAYLRRQRLYLPG
ncbi:MAG: nicotinate (nicotinamide) nucleotide adenylyltransferase [Acidobacteria bacterium]|nr:MAG: nicotinate (nicotinamide) nucleotide adenylyltransferase [Acidobacteriota bacterium]